MRSILEKVIRIYIVHLSQHLSYYSMFFGSFSSLRNHPKLQVIYLGSQSIVSALVAPGNLLEMLILGPHPRPTESETTEVRPAICVSQALQVMGIQATVEKPWVTSQEIPVSRSQEQPSVSCSALTTPARGKLCKEFVHWPAA